MAAGVLVEERGETDVLKVEMPSSPTLRRTLMGRSKIRDDAGRHFVSLTATLDMLGNDARHGSDVTAIGTTN